MRLPEQQAFLSAPALRYDRRYGFSLSMVVITIAVTAAALNKLLSPPNAHLMTDMYAGYSSIGKQFASHQTVNHGIKVWKRGNVHTNTIESYFSIFKRGMKGVYQHCSEDHLNRYLAEFNFRYNHRSALKIDDAKRCDAALKAIQGKRLT